MKLFNKILSAVVASTLLFGCSSNEEDKTPGDKEFILNVEKALENRWDVADETDANSLTGAKQQRAFEKAIDVEYDAIGKLSKYEFEDKDLKKAAETYMKGLDLQKEGIQYVGTDDYINQNKTWILGMNYRIVSLKTFEKDFGLTVNSKRKEDLDDLVAQYSVAKKEVAIQEYVNDLQSKITYTKDETKSDEFTTYYTTVIENTTEYTIDSLQIQINFLDGSGVVIDQGNDFLDNFAAGSKVQSSIMYLNDTEPTELQVTVSAGF